MADEGAATRIAKALETLSRDLDALQEAGGHIPAVERNTVRMRGTLRALQVQFEELDRLAP
ncbi:MAG: hypothetical protein SCH98_11315 [Deferrisomatales bacterium]|nr:hypothetical protein [Deferrisomatales bacterium]